MCECKNRSSTSLCCYVYGRPCLFRFDAQVSRYLCVTIGVLMYAWTTAVSRISKKKNILLRCTQSVIIKILVEKEFLVSNAFPLHIGKNVFILRRCWDKNGNEMNQNVECTCKACGRYVACKSIAYHPHFSE